MSLTSDFFQKSKKIIRFQETLFKKWNFSLSFTSINVTKSSANCVFDRIYWRIPSRKTSFCVQWDIPPLFCPDSDTKGYYPMLYFVTYWCYNEKIYEHTNRRKHQIKNSKCLPQHFYGILVVNVINV